MSLMQLSLFLCDNMTRVLCDICDYKGKSCNVGVSCVRGVAGWLEEEHNKENIIKEPFTCVDCVHHPCAKSSDDVDVEKCDGFEMW